MIPRSLIVPLKGSRVSARYMTTTGTKTRTGILTGIGMKRLMIEIDSGFLYRIPIAVIQSIKEV
ncbi:MAG: hypothetical protein B2I17_03370 [Thermoplasmatales archaeon B_DKE]|nr:MAG: hypothetical protein B2I17_03370 [Thermoplasmatales archaeon B_DKE]